MPNPTPMEPVTNPVLVDAMATFKLDLANRDNEETFKEHEIAFLKAAIEAKYLLPAQVEQPAEPQPEGEPHDRSDLLCVRFERGCTRCHAV